MHPSKKNVSRNEFKGCFDTGSHFLTCLQYGTVLFIAGFIVISIGYLEYILIHNELGHGLTSMMGGMRYAEQAGLIPAIVYFFGWIFFAMLWVFGVMMLVIRGATWCFNSIGKVQDDFYTWKNRKK